MTPIFDTTIVKKTIKQQLEAAQSSIEIAMAWFTDADLAQALSAATKRHIIVRVILYDDNINRESSINWDKLCAENIELYWYKDETAVMHHKFCVIDKQNSLFGTYNWTYKAANSNEETFFESDNKDTAIAFEKEFYNLLKKKNITKHTSQGNQRATASNAINEKRLELLKRLASRRKEAPQQDATTTPTTLSLSPLKDEITNKIQSQNMNPSQPGTHQNNMEYLQSTQQMPTKTKPYTAYITRSTPSVFVFLIDQSGSMSDKVSLKNGTITTKAAFTAEALNATLNSLLDRCIKGNEIREYFEVAVIGYGNHSTIANMAWQGALEGKTWVGMNELATQFLEEKDVVIESNIRGRIIEKTIKRKSWIKPLAKNQTPMHHAFRLAAELLDGWLVAHKGKDIYPPTIINITDGQFTDAKNEDMQKVTQRIKQMKTIDGNVLLFNLHISTKGSTSVLFPHSENDLPQNDPYASILFEMSSVLPEVYNQEIAKLLGTHKMFPFTAMAYNAHLDKLIGLMNIGTSTTTRQIQQLLD